DPVLQTMRPGVLEEKDRHRVGFLSGRAPGAPDADFRCVQREEGRHDLLAERLPDLVVPKELADVDRHRREEALEFLRIALQDGGVIRVAMRAACAHAYGQSSPQALLLVSLGVEPR